MCRHQAFPGRGIHINTTQAITEPWLATVHSFLGFCNLMRKEIQLISKFIVCVCVVGIDSGEERKGTKTHSLRRLNY